MCLSNFDCGEFKIKISARERAALEMTHWIKDHNHQKNMHTFHECLLTFENLMTLCPNHVHMLLEHCTSVKVKRIFLFLCERLNHAWMREIDFTKIDLGCGDRQLNPQGRYDSKYHIPYPKDLFEDDTLHMR